MPSSNTLPTGEGSPPVLVGELTHWLLSATAHCVIGLTLGMLAARVMRARHLHWSWAASALTLLLLLKPDLGGVTLTFAIAAMLAALRGRRWHREDIQAGGDMAALARARLAPLDLTRMLIRRAALRLRAAIGRQRAIHKQALLVGLDATHRPVTIPFAGVSGRHALVVGATGSGKTVTQTWIATCAIDAGMGAIVIDPKGDSGMREQLRRAAASAGRSFMEWTPNGGCVYNPYAGGGASEIADKALAGERFTEPHYLRQAQRYLAHVVRVLQHTGTQVSLRAIVEHLDPGHLEVLARTQPEHEARKTFAYLDSLSSRQHADLAGVRDRLAILVESDVGGWLDPQTDGAAQIDLLTAVRERATVYFSLESDRRPLLSQMLGAAIVQDLQTVVAASQARPCATLVVIDEFSAIAAEHVVRLFGRARSAGFSLLLGTQELCDLRPPGREHLLEQVLGNLSVLIAHRQVVPSSAELISHMAGSKGTWRVSRHSDGRTTRTRGSEPRLEANQVMSLDRGCAAVLALEHGGSVHVARMLSPTHRP
jgi:hypothetical protein